MGTLRGVQSTRRWGPALVLAPSTHSHVTGSTWVSNPIFFLIIRVSLIHEVGDKINVDSYCCAVRPLHAGAGGLVQLHVLLGLDGHREERRVPDSARDPTGTSDGFRRLGWREGGLQLPVAARASRVLPPTDAFVLQCQRPALWGGL